MLFTEPAFLFVFLPATLLVYYAAPERFRNAILALASLLFYAFGERRFLPWLVASVALNYWIGRGIQDARGTPWARTLLVIGIITDLALLVVFKYAGFIVANTNVLLQSAGFGALPVPAIELPLGISFFTFHKISYKVDVYRGVAEAKRTPVELALYILLFPQLIAGPIVRFNEIATELVRRVWSRPDFADGIRRFVVGLGKKMILANPVAYCADRIFAIPTGELTTELAWLGIVCYALQIYFDFSGYSDMAVGLAKMFGFHFPENFNHPYSAQSITDFWRRWHMSLSRFFRDYVYIPLGGNRCSPARVTFNLALVFFLCGLWHGASWNFVIWGLVHGALLGIERAGLGQTLTRMPRVVRHVYTLLMVLVGWVFFRAETLPQATAFLAAMAGMAEGAGVAHYLDLYVDSELVAVVIVAVIFAAPLRRSLVEAVARARAAAAPARARVLDATVTWGGVASIAAIFTYSMMSTAVGTYNPFIYFRF